MSEKRGRAHKYAGGRWPSFHRTTERRGTSLRGYLPSQLTEAAITTRLGEPVERNGDKTTVEWAIRFDDGFVATVYDYKGSRWHVGGSFPEIAARVARIFDVEKDLL